MHRSTRDLSIRVPAARRNAEGRQSALAMGPPHVNAPGAAVGAAGQALGSKSQRRILRRAVLDRRQIQRAERAAVAERCQAGAFGIERAEDPLQWASAVLGWPMTRAGVQGSTVIYARPPWAAGPVRLGAVEGVVSWILPGADESNAQWYDRVRRSAIDAAMAQGLMPTRGVRQ